MSTSRWKNRRLGRFALAAMVIGIIAVNAIAYMQARAMTHFTSSHFHTLRPESLSRFQKIEVLFTGVRIHRPENLITPTATQLRFQTYRFGGPRQDDCESWYIPSDRGRRSNILVIGFPGYVASKSSLLGVAASLHDMGCDVMLVDFRGTGGSRGNTTSIGYREAEDVAAACAFATRQWPADEQVLYGQSMGGAALLRAVAELGVSPRGIIIESVYDRLLSTADNRFHAMGLPSFPLAQLLMFWGSVEMRYNGFKMNPADFAREVRCPVLLMQGGRDPRVTDAEARHIFDQLPGTKLWDYYPEAGHCEFLLRFPQQWTTSVQEFIAPLLPGSSSQKAG